MDKWTATEKKKQEMAKWDQRAWTTTKDTIAYQVICRTK